MYHASDKSAATHRLSGGVIGFSRIMAAVGQFFAQDAMGFHYAVRILRRCGLAQPCGICHTESVGKRERFISC